MDKTEALIHGLVTYTPTKPCKRGHVSARYTANGACLACLSLKRTRGLFVRLMYVHDDDRARLEEYAASLLAYRAAIEKSPG